MDIGLKDSMLYQKIIYVLILLFTMTACTKNYHAAKLSNLMEIVQNEYVQDVNTTKLTDAAIAQILFNLDQHSVYLKRQDLENFLNSTIGEYAGIGIYMGMQNSLLTVIAPLPNTPAQKAGIKSGDIILKINNHSTLGLSLEKSVALTKGVAGTDLALTIMRKSNRKPLLFRIKRAYIDIKPVSAKKIGTDILYIKIPSFNKKVTQQLKKIISKNHNTKKLILDLRSNPGGILSQAVSITNMFIDKGIIVTQKGRKAEYNTQYLASSASTDTKSPMVVLIDRGSASASEIVAGALQAHKRATIIGEKSFGKGSVQTLFFLDENSAVKLTIAKYYLPNGKCIHGIGIKPDIVIRNKNTSIKKQQSISTKKVIQMLKKIQNGSLKPIVMPKKTFKPSRKNHTMSKNEIKNDYPLKKAIKVLKNSN